MAVLAVISLGLLSPYASPLLIPGQPDLANSVGHLIQAGRALQEGQFPIRIAPWEMDGWRYSVFQFHAPFTYTILGSLGLVVEDPWLALKIGIFLALVTSGCFFFTLALDLTASASVSLIAAVAYICSPILMFSLYTLGAIPQAFAQCLIPVCLVTIFRFHQAPSVRRFLIAALTMGCLVLSHLTTGILFAGAILLFSLLNTILSPSQRSLFPRTACVMVAALLLLAYFLVPLRSLSEIRVMGLLGKPHLNAISFPTIMAPTSLSPGWTASPSRPGPAVGFPVLAGLLLLVYRLGWRKDPAWRLRGFAISLLLTWCVVFLAAWSPLDFWEYLPRAAHVVQYPYRILSQVHWLGILALALGLAPWLKEQRDGNPLPTFAGVALSVLFATSYLNVPASGVSKQAVMQTPTLGSPVFVEETPEGFGVRYRDGHEFPLTYEGRWMMLEKDFSLPRALISGEPGAVLRLTGTLSNEREFATAAKPPMGIRLVSGTKTVASRVITARDFVWEVPLREIAKVLGPGEAAVPVRYVLEKRLIPHELNPLNADGRILGIHPAAVTLQNVSQNILEVAAVRKDCRAHRYMTSCEVTLSSDRNVQLPVIHYRHFVQVRVNGRPSSYSPMGAIDSRGTQVALTAVALKAGKSHVEVEFVGSRVGNWISLLTLAGLTVAAAAEAAMARRRVSANQSGMGRPGDVSH